MHPPSECQGVRLWSFLSPCRRSSYVAAAAAGSSECRRGDTSSSPGPTGLARRSPSPASGGRTPAGQCGTPVSPGRARQRWRRTRGQARYCQSLRPAKCPGHGHTRKTRRRGQARTCPASEGDRWPQGTRAHPLRRLGSQRPLHRLLTSGKEGKAFFFEEQKTSGSAVADGSARRTRGNENHRSPVIVEIWASGMVRRARRTEPLPNRVPQEQKFFNSLFQKRTACL